MNRKNIVKNVETVQEELHPLNRDSFASFMNDFYLPGKPVVFSKGSRESFDVEGWSWKRLNSYFKSVSLDMQMRDINNSKSYRQGKGGFENIQMPADFIQRFFFQNSSEYQNRHKYYMALISEESIGNEKGDNTLFKELRCLPFIPNIHRGPFVWIGPSGRYECNHTDSDDNFLLVLKGSKRVRLFSNDYDSCLYPDLKIGYSVQSPIDLESSEDLDKYPKINESVCYEVDLNEGDVLYIPLFWWHQVSSLTDSVSANIFMSCESESNSYWRRLSSKRNFISLARHLFVNIIGNNKRVWSLQSIKALTVNCELRETLDSDTLEDISRIENEYGSLEHFTNSGFVEFELIRSELKRYSSELVDIEDDEVKAGIERVLDCWKNHSEFRKSYFSL